MKTVRKYHLRKRANCKATGHEYLLSESDIHLLLYQAGITIDQVGKGREDYALARYNDTGPYALGNCRFITVLENIRENRAGNKGKYARTPEMIETYRKRTKRQNRTSKGTFASY